MKVESESRGPRNCSPHGNQVETCMLCSLGLHGARHPPSTGTLLFTSGISRPMQNDLPQQQRCWMMRQGQNLTEKVQNTHVSEWLAAKVKWSDPKRCPSAATLGQLLQISNGLAQAPRSWQITMPTGKTHPHYTHWLAEAQKMRRSEKNDKLNFNKI